MKITPDSLKGKKVLVVGLARSGRGAANILSLLGADVTVTDRKPRSSLEDDIRKLPPEVPVIAGDTPERLFISSDLIVVSPGVPLSIPQIERAVAKGIPVIGELELAYQLVAQPGPETPGDTGKRTQFIGITGTNGKSTTATLVHLMLKMSGFKSLLCGNIGRAVTEEMYTLGFGLPGKISGKIDYIVAEVSSFQLETVVAFRPGVAAVLNITPDHLDRYNSMDEYVGTKAKIFEKQEDRDRLVLNADDLRVMEMYGSRYLRRGETMPEVYFFSRNRVIEGVYLRNGTIFCNLPHIQSMPPHFPIISADEVKISGVHNLENAMAAAAISILSGCRPQAVRSVLIDFPGLAHRMEAAGEQDGVRFINDSKGTNTGAVMKSLQSFDNLILIMGGRDKGEDFSVLRDLIAEKVKALILLGEAKEKIRRETGGVTETVQVKDMDEAVREAVARASAGDVIMLSPGCASFDMYVDFEERGRDFKEAVRKVDA